MTAGGQARAERHHRKRVAGVPERAEEQPEPSPAGSLSGPSLRRGQPPASSAMALSCTERSSVVNAIGATISVPTPAAR